MSSPELKRKLPSADSDAAEQPADRSDSKRRRRWGSELGGGSAAAADTTGNGNDNAVVAADSKPIAKSAEEIKAEVAAKRAELQQRMAAQRAALEAKKQQVASTAATPAATTASTSALTVQEQIAAAKERIDKLRAEQLAKQQAQTAATATQKPAAVASSAAAPTAARPSAAAPAINPYLSGFGALTAADRQSRKLNFAQPGKHIAQAQTLRMKQLQSDLKQRMDDKTQQNKAQSEQTQAANAPLTVMKVKQQQAQKSIDELVPAVEWWDLTLFTDGDDTQQKVTYDMPLKESRLTSYIYHPIELPVVGEKPPPPPQAAPLTKRERRKLRKRNREHKLQEQRDRIALGLDPPQENKLRLRNLTSGLLNNSVADPSALEANIKSQMEARHDKHVADNKARQLTAEQRSAKHAKAFTSDLSDGVHVNVYRVYDLTSNKVRYKLQQNAQQMQLTGIGIIHTPYDFSDSNPTAPKPSKIDDLPMNVVVVEGGMKAIRKYQALMLRRIDWLNVPGSKLPKLSSSGADGNAMSDVDDSDLSDDDMNDQQNNGSKPLSAAALARQQARASACQLVWSGRNTEASFKAFNFEVARSELQARKLLERSGVEQYWHIAKTFNSNSAQSTIV